MDSLTRFRRGWTAGVLAAVIAASSLAPGRVCAQGSTENKDLPIPPEFKESTETEFALGQLITIYDDVAWIGTDAVQAAGYKPTDPATEYVVEPAEGEPDGVYQLEFVSEATGKAKVVASAVVDHRVGGMGKVVSAHAASPASDASDTAQDLYTAITAAVNAPGIRFCQGPYNHVVVPYQFGSGKVEYWVYFLLSTTKQGEVPVGGHVLVRVAEDTKTVLEVRPLSASCNTMPGADDPRIVALSTTNLALDSPSAAQVYLMYRYRKPVFMGTKNKLIWRIDPKGIALVEDMNKKKPATN